MKAPTLAELAVIVNGAFSYVLVISEKIIVGIGSDRVYVNII